MEENINRPEWNILLIPSYLKGVKGLFPKLLSPGVRRKDDLAALVAERMMKKKSEVLTFMDAIEEVMMGQLAEGYTVQTGVGTLAPAVTGTWDFQRIQPTARARNKAVVNYTMSTRLKKIFANPLFHEGNPRYVHRPQIAECIDHASGAVNDLLTPGQMAFLHGRLMRFLPEVPEHGVFIETADTAERVAFFPASRLPKASGKEIIIQVPWDLKPGQYRIGLVNQCTNSGRPTKELRTARLEAVLRVAEEVNI